MYHVKRAAGWHNEVVDPTIMTTDDRTEAAMRAGCRIDIRMAGHSGRYDAYAVDDDGHEIERIESFRCAVCGKVVEWGEDGPTGIKDGRVLECPDAAETHLVSWVCDDCLASLEDADTDDSVCDSANENI